MKKKKPPSNDKSDEYLRFEEFARQIISVPKSEIDKREAEYQKARKAAKKRKAA
jgi:hypothetical protein